MAARRVGIIVGGGPAPGINAVIGSATIEAINQGFEVIGFFDGFKWLCRDDYDASVHTRRLIIPMVSRIHFEGGSILRTSRASLLDERLLKVSTVVAPDEQKLQRVVSRLGESGITDLITIGGDDTALSARFITDAAAGRIRSVHVPKTIDNDLPLPHDVATFGFSTACFLGTQIVKNLMQDSLTTGRWYLVTCMGRGAGWLAMSIGQSAGATVTLIPEEFGENTTLQRISDVLEGAILKRRAMGYSHGVALVAEGLAYRLGDRAELQRLLGKEVPVDAAGHLRLSEVPLGEMLKRELEARFQQRSENFTVVTHMLGYELRSADPTPGDMSYCRSLGYGCIRLLMNENLETGVMVTLINGNLVPMRLQDMVDSKTNRIRQRKVDLASDAYLVSRSYMIRLETGDLENAEMLSKLAKEANLSPAQFAERYRSAATRVIVSPKTP